MHVLVCVIKLGIEGLDFHLRSASFEFRLEHRPAWRRFLWFSIGSAG